MKRLARLALVLMAALSAPLGAQQVNFFDADRRVETLVWREGGELALRTTIGGELAVIFAPGEVIQRVVVSDPEAFKVSVAPQADSLFIRTEREPRAARIDVQTQLRDYHLTVTLGTANDVAYAVRFAVPAPGSELPSAPATIPGTATTTYALKGEKTLLPAQIRDDGERTYIEWGKDQPLPAVFALSPQGGEQTVDPYMRGGIMVIDRVYGKLIFRIGRKSAQASRITAPGRRPQ